MRPSNKSRSRNKSGNAGHNNNQRRNGMGNIINRVFESAGPDGKVRGTPQQIIDKYQALARDAQVAGDRVAAESYLQHSEHYSRMLGEAQRQQAEQQNRFNQEREDGQRSGEDQNRSQDQQSQRGNESENDNDDGGSVDHQRRPQPVSSGLTTIEPDDSYETSGPIETPEGRRSQMAPVVQVVGDRSEPQAEAKGRSEAVAEEAPTPAKRPRVRRRAKAEPAPEAGPEAVAQGE